MDSKLPVDRHLDVTKRIWTLRPGLTLCAAGLILYLLLTTGLALTRTPYVDEGYFASPGRTLAVRGYMGTTVLEPCHYPLVRGKAYTLRGIDRHTYWIMPLHPLTQAAWYKLFGFSLAALRFYSIAWSLIFVVAWIWIIWRLSGSPRASVLAGFLLAFDQVVLVRASQGRMDVMSAALGGCALAAYLTLRERRSILSLLLANLFVVLAGLTHPVGGAVSFLGVWCLVLGLDRVIMHRKAALVAAVPYLVGALAWGGYILQDPSAFSTQFSANTSGRVQNVSAVWRLLDREIRERYLPAYGLGKGGSEIGKFKFVVLASYVWGLSACLAIRRLRKQPGARILLTLTALYALASGPLRWAQAGVLHSVSRAASRRIAGIIPSGVCNAAIVGCRLGWHPRVVAGGRYRPVDLAEQDGPRVSARRRFYQCPQPVEGPYDGRRGDGFWIGI